ncbi:hypothetical protein SAMN05421741_102101 [Paenimyroides ummariense]|uniref:Uncharacterized protein n=1 Tax=Paenimyroides ummariense TaxID=913024 RepID=A0A1I4X4U3_9FLAO|nr:hypothetical protein [Paenimyroides ummariense]SFN20523.1 hypothetical protein SAMN05421741_10299 [Paenimyroides ummariense]SFN20571.1 hypothetical protein SAMN05421741_102101 [Paenimyroides ummariense]
MKNLIYSIILIASSNIYAQSGIESDALFLKYEKAYLEMGSSNLGRDYEQANQNFYSNFTDHKERNKFSKSKDKEKWLNKNYKKTSFVSSTEAVNSYTSMVNAQEAIDKMSNDIQAVRNELLKKYDVNLIWTTLQNRIKAK